jgi:hypothetical protein
VNLLQLIRVEHIGRGKAAKEQQQIDEMTPDGY